MSITPFKEVAELSKTRLADSPLGKLVEGKSFDKPMSEYDKPLGVVSENFKNCPIEGNNGHWDGERGDSKWIPDRNYIPGKANPDGETWGEILDEYGIDGTSFIDGEPDFSEISKGDVEIELFSDSRTDNFDKADVELSKERGWTPEDATKWRKENRYTWHECKDMKTMQLVPNKIHNNISHSGGISEVKKGNGEMA